MILRADSFLKLVSQLSLKRLVGGWEDMERYKTVGIFFFFLWKFRWCCYQINNHYTIDCNGFWLTNLIESCFMLSSLYIENKFHSQRFTNIPNSFLKILWEHKLLINIHIAITFFDTWKGIIKGHHIKEFSRLL